MYDNDIRWYVLVPVAIIIAFGQLVAETSGLYFSFPARPSWLWCLAFFATLRTPPTPAIIAIALCGFIRDLSLGPKPGSASLAFIVVGWLALSWRLLASERSFAYQTLFVGVTAFLVSLLKHSLDYGFLTHKLIDRVFFVSVGDALLTLVAYPLLALALSFKSFRPWREIS